MWLLGFHDGRCPRVADVHPRGPLCTFSCGWTTPQSQRYLSNPRQRRHRSPHRTANTNVMTTMPATIAKHHTLCCCNLEPTPHITELGNCTGRCAPLRAIHVVAVRSRFARTGFAVFWSSVTEAVAGLGLANLPPQPVFVSNLLHLASVPRFFHPTVRLQSPDI